MNELGGWFGWRGEPAAGAAAMAAVLGAQTARAEGPGHLLLAAGPRAAKLHTAPGLKAGIQGRPRWRHADLRVIAEAQGHAAALAHAYREYGSELLPKALGGSFALVVIDPAQQRVLLGIDRMGVGTLSVALRNGVLVFATRADAVAAHPAVAAGVDQQGLYNYLHAHCVPAPGTIFRGVSKLLPGQCMELSAGQLRPRQYWQMRYTARPEEAVDALQARLRETLRDAVRAQLDARRSATFLSGGIDSSTVSGLVVELGGRAHAYSIGFDVPGYDEMRYARLSAAHFGLTGHEYYVTPEDVVELIPRIAAAFDEPFGNASAVPAYCCARAAAADGVEALLAGDGGDELFGGNARYARQRLFEAYQVLPPSLRGGVIEPLLLGLPGGDLLPPLRKLRSYLRQARVPLPDRLEAYNFLQREPPERIFEPGFLQSVQTDVPMLLARKVYGAAPSRHAVQRMMYLDLKQTLADNDLRKVGRMCALAGVEARFPLLDDGLVALSGEVPAALQVRGRRLRWFFKQALRGFLPPPTLAKTKHGFGLPFGHWLITHAPLDELARASLHALGQRGVVRADYLEWLYAANRRADSGYYGVMIWVLVQLEQWLSARRL